MIIVDKLRISIPVTRAEESGLEEFLNASPEERIVILSDAYKVKVQRQYEELERANGSLVRGRVL
jgi:hypothetical protein